MKFQRLPIIAVAGTLFCCGLQAMADNSAGTISSKSMRSGSTSQHTNQSGNQGQSGSQSGSLQNGTLAPNTSNDTAPAPDSTPIVTQPPS